MDCRGGSYTDCLAKVPSADQDLHTGYPGCEWTYGNAVAGECGGRERGYYAV